MLEFIKSYEEQNAADPKRIYRINATRQERSEQLGMIQKTLDRTIKRLKEDGLIVLDKGKVCFTAQQLRKIKSQIY